jgi:hypothetical protein
MQELLHAELATQISMVQVRSGKRNSTRARMSFEKWGIVCCGLDTGLTLGAEQIRLQLGIAFFLGPQA